MNDRGIKFLHQRTLPLDVYTMDRAAEVISRELGRRADRMAAGEPLGTDCDGQFATHLAWLIGFDRLVNDRKVVFDFVDKLVED